MNFRPQRSSSRATHPVAAVPAMRARRATRRRGTILVIVLGTVFVLSMLISAFLEITRKEIILRGMYFGRETMRVAAYSGLEATLGVLNTFLQIDGGLYGPTQGWADPLNQPAWGNSDDNSSGNVTVIYTPPDGMTINVSITDYTGMIPLNRMSDNDMLALFDSLGVDPTQGQVLLDTFRDWTSPYTGNFSSDGAGSDYYETLNPGYDPTYTNITDFDEFHYIKNWQDLFWDENGAETPLYGQFRSMVTLHDSGGPVNLNTAVPAVLDWAADQYLSEIDETTTQSYLWGADGLPGTPDDMMIRNSDEMTTAGVLSANGSAGNSTGNATTGNATTGGAAGAAVTRAETLSSGSGLFAALSTTVGLTNAVQFGQAAAIAAGGGGGGAGGGGGGGAGGGGAGGAGGGGGAGAGGGGGGAGGGGGRGGAGGAAGAGPGGGGAGGGPGGGGAAGGGRGAGAGAGAGSGRALALARGGSVRHRAPAAARGPAQLRHCAAGAGAAVPDPHRGDRGRGDRDRGVHHRHRL
ncbi:MAG TPA: hypothetical protein VK737_04630, partial [Opitutales bacterium]|nr:hypothetical protein [Opitutales bacterium]